MKDLDFWWSLSSGKTVSDGVISTACPTVNKNHPWRQGFGQRQGRTLLPCSLSTEEIQHLPINQKYALKGEGLGSRLNRRNLPVLCPSHNSVRFKSQTLSFRSGVKRRIQFTICGGSFREELFEGMADDLQVSFCKFCWILSKLVILGCVVVWFLIIIQPHSNFSFSPLTQGYPSCQTVITF